MKTYNADKIRNVALLGHSSCGKTTITEALLLNTKVTNRMGKVEDGNTVSDFDKEEKERQVSIGTSIIPIEYQDTKTNFLDTPGYFDFVGEVYGALKVADSAVLVIDASSGIEVGTEKSWKYLEQRNMPRIIFVNKLDKENIKFDELLDNLRDKFGKKVIPFALPIGKGENTDGYMDILKGQSYIGSNPVETFPDTAAKAEELKAILMESVAETDEALLEKYFEGEEFTDEEIHTGLKNAVLAGELVPVIVGAATKGLGADMLMNTVIEYLPNALDANSLKGDPSEPLSAFVFKTIVDPFVGKISLYKVMSGTMKKDADVYNADSAETERIGSVFSLRGKDQIDVSGVEAGDIGATSKLQHFKTGDTISLKSAPVTYDRIDFPKPCYFMAITGKTKDSDEKIGTGLHRLNEEDPTFSIDRNVETKELVVGGQGSIQLDVIASKLKNNYKVDVDLNAPKVAYRETIKGKSDVQGKHKKQSGGAGQYGDVHIRFEPSQEEFEFAEEIFGGSVPRNYIPAVEKGLRECLDKGVLAGCKVVNVKATLYDGSYHDVDSNEMAFKIAASLAFKKGMMEAKPILLEPIAKVEVNIPDEYLGDIMGDMNKRRGRILGMEQQLDGSQIVKAEAPMAEMYTYAIELKSMTQARGTFEVEFLRYDEMPSNLAEKVIADYKAENEN
ncbi:MAG: elongation factor G [Tissierellia bacterium]|jgi:elongation factor G|nr:elongation factor G [Tissierellia bacterium]MDD3227395.1 elongation factor G [Tissierellia bacterium]MDD3751875.1 elongation factor G [Tissierellia bacterium]MDD4047013.1 elongation factor G [Tissierellia bacterium]MDD4678585.1 elongation factor G [Tissierellia bacterium]